MASDFELKYQTYVNIYKHYSELMFKARISIISIIFLAYGYILEIIPGKQDIIREEIVKVLTPVCAAALMSGIFLLEVSYYNNFFRAIRALKELENMDEEKRKCPFFSGYERRNWHFCVLYLAASVLFSVVCINNIIHYKENLSESERAIALAISFFPLLTLFWVWTLLNHNYFRIIRNYDMRGVELILVSLLFNEKIAKKTSLFLFNKKRKYF